MPYLEHTKILATEQVTESVTGDWRGTGQITVLQHCCIELDDDCEKVLSREVTALTVKVHVNYDEATDGPRTHELRLTPEQVSALMTVLQQAVVG